MLTAREKFKTAFLLKAARLGMTLEETHELVKQALAEPETKEANTLATLGAIAAPFTDVGKHIAKSTWDSAKNLGGLGLYATPVVTAGIGGLLGHTAAKAEGLGSDVTAEEEKQRELVDAYRRAAEQARMASSVRRKQDKQRSRVGYGIV